MSKDIFDKKINDIKTPDWRQILTDVRIPKPPAASRSSSSGLQAFNHVMQTQRRQQQEAERAQREAEKQQAAQQKELEKQLEANPGLGAPAWEDVKAQIEGYDDLPFKAKREKYDEYLATATEIAREFNPTANELDVKFSVQENNPFTDQAPTRTFGERLMDYDSAMGRGVWGSIGGAADFFSSPYDATGRMFKSIGDFAQSNVEHFDKRRSAVSKDRQAQTAYEAQRFAEENPDAGAIRKIAAGIGRTIRNPSLETAIETAGGLAVSAIPGGAAGHGVRLLGAGAKAARRFSLGALTATNAAIEGGSLARDAYERVMNTPWEELDAELREEALADNDGDREKAHEALAVAAMTKPRIIGAIIGGVSTVFSPVDRAVSRLAGGARSTVRSGIRRGVGTTLGEAGVSGVEEGLLGVSGNIATRRYVPGLDWTEGVGERIGTGAIGGGGVGAAVGTAQAFRGGGGGSEQGGSGREGSPDAGDAGGESVSDIPGFGETTEEGGTSATPEINPEIDIADILTRYDGDINTDLEAATDGDAAATQRLTDFGLSATDIASLNTQRVLSGGVLVMPETRTTETPTPTEEAVDTETPTPTEEAVDTETPTPTEEVVDTETTTPEEAVDTETPTPEEVVDTETPTPEEVVDTETPTPEEVVDTETTTPTEEDRGYSREYYEGEVRSATLPENVGNVDADLNGRRILFTSDSERAAFLLSDPNKTHPRQSDLEEFVSRSLGDVSPEVVADYVASVRQHVENEALGQPGGGAVALSRPSPIPDSAWATHQLPPALIESGINAPNASINRQQNFPARDADGDGPTFEDLLSRHIENSNQPESVKQWWRLNLQEYIRQMDDVQRRMDDPNASRLARDEALRKYMSMSSSIPRVVTRGLGISPNTLNTLMKQANNRVKTAFGEAVNRSTVARPVPPSSRLRKYLKDNRTPTVEGLRQSLSEAELGSVQVEALRKLLNLYEKLSIPLPSIVYKPLPEGRGGAYYPGAHRIEVEPNTSLYVLHHELLHGITDQAFNAMQASRSAESRSMEALLNSIHDQVRAATEGFPRYGASMYPPGRVHGVEKNRRALAELFAELVNPSFTDALNNINFIPPGVDDPARAAFDKVMRGAENKSIIEAFADMITGIIRAVLPIGAKSSIDPQSILEVLNAATAEMARGTSVHFARSGPKNVYDSVGNTKAVADQFHSDQADANLNGAGPVDNDITTGERESTAQTITDIQEGKQASPATFRGALRHAYNEARKAPQDQGKVSAFFQALNNSGMSYLNMHFHNHKEPFLNWVNRLPDSVSEFTRQSVKGALETAAVKRDHHLGEIMHDSGRAMFAALADLGKANKNLSQETVKLRAGQWLTAVRAPTANAKLLQRDIADVKRITKEYSDAVKAEAAASDPVEAGVLARKTTALRKQLTDATGKMNRRQQAINNPDLTTTVHAEGVAGGMSNAMAAEVRRAVEAQFGGTEALERVAKHVYDMNAYVLALDIETGRSNPVVVGEFLDRPDLIPLFNQLVAAARDADASQPASVQLLKDLRTQVRDAVRSDYVPMSGNPKIGLDPDLFMSGTSVPNTGGLHMMDGRKTTIADDGITASWNRAINSATFAGYHEFTKQLHDVWTELGSSEARNSAGIYRQTLKDKNSFPRDAVIYRTQDASYALRFDNPLIMQSIKAQNMQDANIIMAMMAKPTQWMAYMMTQGNPAFAPKNAFRDAIERSENMRFRNYYREDGTEYTQAEKDAAARNMLSKYGSWQFYAAAMKYAWTRKAPDTYYGRMLEEMVEQGGVSVFGDRFARDNTNFTRNIMREKSHVKKTVSSVGRLVDSYNRGFDILSSISSYTALREMGMDAQTAGAEALDLMNFRKTGKAMPLLRAAYVFAQPAVTGGANIVTSMYDRRTGKVRPRALARFGAYTLMLMMVQGMIRAFSDEDEGGKLSDQLGEFIHAGNIPIPVGDGSYFLVTTPYGYLRLAAGIGRNALQVFAGEKGVGEAVSDFIGGTVIPSITPFEYTMIDLQERPWEGIILGVMPTWLEPIGNLAMNRTSFDTPIVNDNYEKRDQYRHEQYGGKIAPIYKDMAKYLHEWTGADLPPEQVRFLFQQYGQGIFRLAGNMMIEDPYKESVGKLDTPALVKTFFARPHPNVISAQFYEHLEKANSAMRKYNAPLQPGSKVKLSEEEMKYVYWLNRWEKTNQALVTEKGRITRNKIMSEAAKDRRKEFVDEKRSAAQRRALYEIRKTLGLTTEWTGY